MLPQQIELLETKAKLENARQEWFQNIKRWRGWLGTDRDSQARENFGNITDPMAVKALLLNLRDDGCYPGPADLCRGPGENQFAGCRHGPGRRRY